MTISPEFEEDVRSSVAREGLFISTEPGYQSKSMIELTDGSLLRTTPAGRSTSHDGAQTWGETVPLRDEKGEVIERTLSHLIRLKSGALGGFWLPGHRKTGVQSAQYDRDIWFSRSDDEGESWSKPVRVSEPYNNVAMHGTPVVTSSGRIVAAVWSMIGKTFGERGRAMYGDELARVGAHGYELSFAYCWAYYSDDEGMTWRSNEGKGVITAGGELFVILDHTAGGCHGCNEPAVVEVSDGHLLMLLRTSLGRFYQSWSSDDGTTWSRPEPSHLAAAQAPPALARIPGTGDLLVLWNQASPEEIESGQERQRLSSAISRDGGATWDHGQNVFALFCDRGDRRYIEPPPIRNYRALELAPRLPANVLLGTYPSLAFWRDRAVIWFRCAKGIDYHVPPETTPEGYVAREVGGPLTVVTTGLPISWFYEGVGKYGARDRVAAH